MIGYVMVGSSNLQRSAEYYDAILAPLGLVRVEDDTDYAGYAPITAKEDIEFYVTRPINGEPATAGNGTMISLLADSREAVDRYRSRNSRQWQ